ncbi:hypothetical protein M0805_009840 [Coniferiporia weirii]|nr:hypothetical protein M0805_009840 [Coniferiporia weirii]
MDYARIVLYWIQASVIGTVFCCNPAKKNEGEQKPLPLSPQNRHLDLEPQPVLPMDSGGKAGSKARTRVESQKSHVSNEHLLRAGRRSVSERTRGDSSITHDDISKKESSIASNEYDVSRPDRDDPGPQDDGVPPNIGPTPTQDGGRIGVGKSLQDGSVSTLKAVQMPNVQAVYSEGIEGEREDKISLSNSDRETRLAMTEGDTIPRDKPRPPRQTDIAAEQGPDIPNNPAPESRSRKRPGSPGAERRTSQRTRGHRPRRNDTTLVPTRGDNAGAGRAGRSEETTKKSTAAATTDSQFPERVAPPTTTHPDGSSIAKRFFRDKVGTCTEKDIVDLCGALNGLTESLVVNLIHERERLVNMNAPDGPIERDGNNETELRIADLVEKALGSQLYKAITQPSGLRSGPDELEEVMQDAWQTWITFCLHLAIKPLLFGFKIRTVDEIEEMFRRMVDQEPDKARYWNELRVENFPNTTTFDPQVQELVKDISPLSNPTSDDILACCLIEETYQRILARATTAGEYQPIALHWRAMLGKQDRSLDSFSDAITQTHEVLFRGLLEVFELAGEARSLPLIDRDRFMRFSLEISRVAAKLAWLIKTHMFSTNFDVFLVSPGRTFDGELMDGQAGETGVVTCTILLGLRELGLAGETKTVFIKPKVLTP